MALLAKSRRNGQEKTLLEHSRDVLQTFQALFGTFNDATALARSWRRFFRIERDDHWDAFYRCGVPTMMLHDLGKANSGFQLAVSKKGSQLLRHEHLSSLVLSSPDLYAWLEKATGGLADIVIAAIVGHHLKAGCDQICAVLTSDSKALRFEKEGLDELVSTLRDAGYPPCENEFASSPTWIVGAAEWTRRETVLKRLLRRTHRTLKQNGSEDVLKLLLALRAALIVSDSAASGLTRECKPLLRWLSQAFDPTRRIDGEYVRANIIEERIRQIEMSGKSFRWHKFQNGAAGLPARALLLAGCGAGKTLSAWRWIENRLNVNPAARVIFLYPTRATATEGFRDYISWAPDADVSLVTGTAAWELSRGLFENPDERSEKNFTTEARLFAIGYWHRRIFSATVDQFLGFMQHSYGSVCLIPMLVDSVVVIDEVHSFDRSLFSALKKFLRQFDVPVLCMTASLPARRREELESCDLTVFPKNLAEFADLQQLSEMRRYRITRVRDRATAEITVRAALSSPRNAKVLWVVNTVARCQEIARAFPDAICYHSGFTLADRQQRHAEVVRRFQEQPGPLLAVTTQVCEMSLDLNADLLVTEEAPITSLIQRMGRCNRYATPQDGRLGDVVVYPPPAREPYSEEDMTGVPAFLEAIDGQELGQLRLQELLEELGPRDVEPEKYAAFIECGVYAVAREEALRDVNDYSVQAILSSDVESFIRARERGDPLDGHILPAPRRLARIDARIGAYPLMVDSGRYSPELGLLREYEEGA